MLALIVDTNISMVAAGCPFVYLLNNFIGKGNHICSIKIT